MINLNEEQQKVVNEQKNNIILLASAGTGKTNTLAERVTSIIKNGNSKPSEILCITFTNKACKEMSDRVMKIVGGEAKDITIRTFHSFCFDVVRTYAKRNTDIFSDFTIFDEDDCREVISKLSYYYATSNLMATNMQIQKVIDFIKVERARIETLEDRVLDEYKTVIDEIFKFREEKINQVCTNKGNLNLNLKNYIKFHGHELVTLYDSKLREDHALDFNDLIILTKELFKDEKVVRALKNKFKYINIDEVQDTSIIEYSIIEKLFEGNNVLICGDFFQTIYSWRGSDPEMIFNKFKEKYNPVEIVFSKNYRATKNLNKASLEFLNNAFSSKVSTIYKDGILAESKEDGEKILLKETRGLREEARFIFDYVNKLCKNGEDLKRVCVLTRDNNYNIGLSEELYQIGGYEGADFEFILVDQFKFFRRQEVKDILAFLKLIANRYDSLSLKRIVNRLPTGIGMRTLEAIESYKYKEVGIRLADYIDPLVLEYGEKFSLLINAFEKENIIVFDVESTGVDVTEDEIIQIAAIKLNKNGEVVDKFEEFLKNKKPVKDSYYVHGFSDEMLQRIGEDKEKVLKEFVEYSKDSIIVGHNVQYDINILCSELERNNLGKPKFKTFYDTLDIYRRFYPGNINYKLENLSKVYDTKHKPSHDAMDDIIATGELLVRAINEKIRETSMERMALMSKHLKAFTAISKKLNELFKIAESKRPYELVACVMNGFNIKSMYAGDENKEKLNRLRDLYALFRDLDDKSKGNRDALLDIIRITGLSNGELESLIINRTKKPRIPIITVHQAKGLEFDTVFLAGIQNNTFPSYMSIKEGNLAEEKRIFYVAITRAKKRLVITYNSQGKYGHRNEISQFINYIPKEFFKII
ncbi:UvrD-helicase domain-containing protein [Clostridium perfringens]|uniref:3'-5' exonuclease n=1 Tax=Clostridium perfringens TaxID=1502 RepID=UPI0018E487A9|nr:3'-5' exonuclease [Clostridium perfringens]EHA0993398.1 UvrD-helicase domain-containing protein [Clostridium perfringens]EHA1184405.1 UvrD-helicase domain-containing protein [Clostridium perfringens]EHK2306143.1 UvrD-helicase domain-containing protein [Clostridium perfringens]EJT6142736.1 UvrD-helicase domain-containing protein [Clostridium perfringens]MBI6083191.1 UvrD-helicase domain-containing protein [Clostridium perfringens]